MSQRFYPICVGILLLLTTLACSMSNPELAPQELEHSPYQSAILSVFPDNATFTGEEIPGALYDFCWPPHTADSGSGFFLVHEEGGLDGQCSSESSDKILQRTGYVTGKYNPQPEEVSFRVETTNTFGGNVMKIVFKGKAPIINGTASGIGDFVYTCSAADGAYCLEERTSLNTNGTMPFQIDFKE